MPTIEEYKQAMKEVFVGLISKRKEEDVKAKEDETKRLLEDEKNKKEKGGDKIMPGDDKKLDELIEKVAKMEEDREKEIKELKETHTADLEATKKEAEEIHKTAIEETNKKLEDTNKKLAESEEREAKKDKELHREKAEATAKQLLDKGIWPAVVEKAKRIMLIDTEGKFGTIKLEDKDGAEEVSLTKAIEDMLNTIPEASRISFEDLSKQKKDEESGGKKFMSVEEVQTKAEEKGISYEEMASKLFSEGKIEA